MQQVQGKATLGQFIENMLNTQGIAIRECVCVCSGDVATEERKRKVNYSSSLGTKFNMLKSANLFI